MNNRRTWDRAEADGSQETHLARALLDAQLEEERRQEQRRDDEEEAEVGEVLAEVGGAARAPRPSALTSLTVRPDASGSSAARRRSSMRLRASASGVSTVGLMRIDDSAPYLDRHSVWPTSRGTNALGVVRY